jgi:hypothetical protein
LADTRLKHSPAAGSIHQFGIRITLRAGVSGGKLITDPGATETLLFQVLTYTYQQ